mgnify:CR=1 FL=1
MIDSLKCQMSRVLRRLCRTIYSRNRFLVYSKPLMADAPPCGAAAAPVEFRINAPEAVQMVTLRGQEYETGKRALAAIPRQLGEGEIFVSGWVGNEMVYYGWIQFRARQLSHMTNFPIPQGMAFIYRCFTRADFRGKRIYPAAIDFMCGWLADQGYSHALIDHHDGNTASQMGILRAGMRPVAEYSVFKVIWSRWAVPDETLRRLAPHA